MKFEIDDKQTKQLNSWYKKHVKTCTSSAGAIGGELGYKFIPTGLGVITVAYCICGKEINLTDFSDW